VSRLRVAPIVEGHGEVQAVRGLLQRIWHEMLNGEHVEVLRPIRQPRSRLIQREHLIHAVDLAARKLMNEPRPEYRAMVLVLLDGNDGAVCELGPQLLGWAIEGRGDVDVACVLANKEYETWFVSAAASLAVHLGLEPGTPVPDQPEGSRQGKAWIQRHLPSYQETVDQARLTAHMDLNEARAGSPSFDKLCRELEKRLMA
jgi:uncharacterized protein DUF4276